ncbi:hypothetical protein KNU39_gp78 [Gordonia phage Mutzi]|uniref:Uncharacterized protein n=1 Tax=Gordonia phage Mutzi TaxID=2500789 RepID=A0A411AXQ7_9CAUD|nr:hypothetical protein KNU39_gp78 [Gordonia phage Mutzi]QAX92888.1 hypothetical protein SEA_MUTZI_78 [Gordonia phage Mutzi]QWY84765.1 hypothetical protein SEA_YUNGMONEY_79 [Gordonia phage YungMoney]
MTAPKRYRKKPVEAEAIQWTGDNPYAVRAFTGMHKPDPHRSGDHFVFTVESGVGKLYVAANGAWLDIEVGEWIIRDAKGFYPCKPDIFAGSYEPVEDDDPLLAVRRAEQRLVEARQDLARANETPKT